jgi:hypothetical protein
MRPLYGISLEVGAFLLLTLLTLAVPGGLVFGIYVVMLELASTYLLHCPGHYLVGTALGIRFTRLRLGRTTLARVLPPRAAGLAKAFPILSLSTDKKTLAAASKYGASAMYASGTVASVASALVIAAVSTFAEPFASSAVAWLVAIGYLVFDVVFSPKSGDLMRARAALRP